MSDNNKKFELDQESKQRILESISKIDHTPIADEVSIKRRNPVAKVISRVFICFITLIIILVMGLLGVVTILNYGPSKSARDLFVMSVMETSAIKFLATWYFSDEEVDAIMARNSVVQTDDVTDVGLVEIPNEDETNDEFDKNGFEIVNITGATYKGKMMIVNDPSRVFVGTSGEYGKDKEGKTVEQMAGSYNALAGVNGGGFEDINGVGKGGVPLGIVISQGELKWGALGQTYEVIGFDNDNKFVVGNMTGQQAIDRGIRDAISFGPILIVNGEPSEVTGTGGGLNPRTAIGQKADGTVLILVVDGRQPNSLGASYKDLIDVMVEYGAVNAANLDGGSSSHMIYKGEVITNCSSLYGPRAIPDSILVSEVR